jgi:adenosylcobinamide-phosphate synthase
MHWTIQVCRQGAVSAPETAIRLALCACREPARYDLRMGLFALMWALLAQRFLPRPHDEELRARLYHWIDRLGKATDAGTRRDGVLAWSLVVVPVVGSFLLLNWIVGLQGLLITVLFHVLVLYFTVDVRAFSTPLGAIQVALAAGDLTDARNRVERWIQQRDPQFCAHDRSAAELYRVAIAEALETAHRHIFAPLFWYVVLPGVIGPILYRLVQLLADRWPPLSDAQEMAGLGESVRSVDLQAGRSAAFAAWGARAYEWLDAIPVRLTAAAFAVVGNFEDAVYCWRAALSIKGPGVQRRVLHMAGGGALGVRLTEPALEALIERSLGGGREAPEREAERGVVFDWQGTEADGPGLRSALGLLWRAVVLWVGVFAMLTAVSGWG